jgi:putative DNA methylase
MTGDYIREEAVAGRMGAELMAIVADGPAGRCYLEATPEQSEEIRSLDPPSGLPTQAVPYPNHDVDRLPMYGMEAWADAYSVRQQIAMTTFVDVVKGMRERILSDAVTAGMPSDGVPFRDGGLGADAYADAVVTYLSFAVDKLADFSSTLCSWNAPNSQFRYVFSRQAIAMTWDFAEVNPLSGQMGSWRAQITAIARSIENCLGVGAYEGQVLQVDARSHLGLVDNVVVSTDPPYYDNISYADVSDYFWIWLRECLSTVWPDETATLLTPKASELIANQYRAGSRSAAREHFESGMSELMQAMRSAQTSSSPATIYYAYKATESADGEVRSTGWDTFVQAVVGSGLQVVATWPLRTERQGRLIDLGSNALASSIVLVCRARDDAAPLASRGEFVSALREELPEAVKLLQSGNIAPVDIA